MQADGPKALGQLLTPTAGSGVNLRAQGSAAEPVHASGSSFELLAQQFQLKPALLGGG
jgi:hypothetical protein